MFFASRSLKAFSEEVPAAQVPRVYAKQLVERYKNFHHNHLLSHDQIGYNTVYVAMQMNQLIQSLQAMYNDGAGSTICRVYFGAHDGEAAAEGCEISNKMTLIFVGAKTEGNRIIERFNDTNLFGLDFGTLCPPQCKSCVQLDNSLATEVFGSGPCDESCPDA